MKIRRHTIEPFDFFDFWCVAVCCDAENQMLASKSPSATSHIAAIHQMSDDIHSRMAAVEAAVIQKSRTKLLPPMRCDAMRCGCDAMLCVLTAWCAVFKWCTESMEVEVSAPIATATAAPVMSTPAPAPAAAPPPLQRSYRHRQPPLSVHSSRVVIARPPQLQ